MFTVAQGELAEGHVEGAAMGEIRNDASDVPRADGGCESKTAYDRCSAPGASRSRGSGRRLRREVACPPHRFGAHRRDRRRVLTACAGQTTD